MPRAIAFLAESPAADVTLERLHLQVVADVLVDVRDSGCRHLVAQVALEFVISSQRYWVDVPDSPVVGAVEGIVLRR